MIGLFFEKLLNLFSTKVPPELSACEFDCKKEECLTTDFLTCSKRLQVLEAEERLQVLEAEASRIDDSNPIVL